MAWAKTLLDASFKGLILDIVKTDDDFTWAVVEHSYPYVNGSDVEGMGRNARRIPLEVTFYGDDYETRLDQFLQAMDSGAGEFVHPIFGSILVTATHGGVHHDADNVDQASVTVEFIEKTPGNPFFDAQQSAVLKADAIAAKSAVAKAAAIDKYATLIDKMRAASPMAGLQNLRQAITGPILAAMDFANVVLANLDPLAYPRSWANDFQSLVDGALSIRSWGQQLEADWASICATFSSLDVFIVPSGIQPEAVDSTSASASTQAQAVAVVQATLDIFMAIAFADAVTQVFSSEANASPPTLDPTALESMSNTTRAAIEAAIAHARSVYTLEDSRPIVESLKDLALSVQSTAAALIEVRPPLVQRTANAPGNMRLLAHQLYGDETRAAELWRLNGARSPFVERGDVVNAYAT